MTTVYSTTPEERLKEAYREMAELRQEVNRLRAELAEKERWEPVADGFEIECDQSPGWKLYASEGDIGVVETPNREKEYYVYAAPHNLHLCRRVEENSDANT
jgi:hypothetical protein